MLCRQVPNYVPSNITHRVKISNKKGIRRIEQTAVLIGCYVVPSTYPAREYTNRVQRCALYIIIGENYKSYSNALEILELETLEERRFRLCEKFAKKSLKHEKYI